MTMSNTKLIQRTFIIIWLVGFSRPAFAEYKYNLVGQDNIFEYHLKKVEWEGREGVRWRLKNKTDISLYVGSIIVKYQCSEGTKRMKHYFSQDIEPGDTSRASYPDWPCSETGVILEHSLESINFHQEDHDYEYNRVTCEKGDPKQIIIKNINDQKSKIIVRGGLIITTSRFKNIPESIVKLICGEN